MALLIHAAMSTDPPLYCSSIWLVLFTESNRFTARPAARGSKCRDGGILQLAAGMDGSKVLSCRSGTSKNLVKFASIINNFPAYINSQFYYGSTGTTEMHRCDYVHHAHTIANIQFTGHWYSSNTGSLSHTPVASYTGVATLVACLPKIRIANCVIVTALGKTKTSILCCWPRN